jgi:hypothetical protein
MTQVMVLMLAMFAGLVGLAFGVFLFPAVPVLFDLLHLIVLVDFVLVLVAVLMEFIQVLPILMKTMQGAPIHSSHITNLLLTMFLALAMVIYYVDIAAIM